MGSTLRAIYIGLQLAPIIAALIIFPYTLVSYLKKRSINVRRSTYHYIFVIYFLCAYFMTMMPLPTPEFFENPRPIGEMIQLIPFKSFADIKAESWLRDVAIIVFNVILTVPLGFFARFLFGFNFKKTLLAGFLTSLLYEVTQITGLFFIYPSPYRFFDVDDLIVNTLGAVIGFLITPVAMKLLPKLDGSEKQLMHGSEVSFFQRAVATALDFGVTFGVSALSVIAITPLRAFFAQSGSLWRFPIFFAIFLIFSLGYSVILRGGSVGQRLVGLRLTSRGGRPATRIQQLKRSLMINVCVLSLPFWIYCFMSINTEYDGWQSIIWVFIAAVLMMCFAGNTLEMLFNFLTHGSSMYYDRLIGTYLSYGNGKKASLFGIRIIDVVLLDGYGVDTLSDEISQTLLEQGVDNTSVTKVRLMAEGVMLDWIEEGLLQSPCELRLDKRFKHKALILSVAGEDKTNDELSDSYTEMLSGLELNVKAYYAGEKNICIIYIP